MIQPAWREPIIIFAVITGFIDATRRPLPSIDLWICLSGSGKPKNFFFIIADEAIRSAERHHKIPQENRDA
jgi:hypothetical protein